ncbi:MAG: hypothetical protein ACREOC_05625 [Gemmatimonadales bacterium]
MPATLFLAVASLVLWAFLLATLPPSGWLHVPLAVGTTLLVRWMALRDGKLSGER